MIKFFCEVCGTQPVDIEPIERDELNDTPHGDICCRKCGLVIATVSADREGTLELVEDGEIAWACSNKDHIKALSAILIQSANTPGSKYTGPTMLFCPFCGLSLGEMLTRRIDAMQVNSFKVTTGIQARMSKYTWINRTWDII